MPRAGDVGMDKEQGRWTVYEYGSSRFLFSSVSQIKARQYAHQFVREGGGSVFIEGVPEEKWMLDSPDRARGFRFGGEHKGGEMQTIHDFIQQAGLEMTSRPWPQWRQYTGALADQWEESASHWWCVIRSTKSRGEIETPYHMGSALRGKPELTDVLSSLLTDALSYLNSRVEGDVKKSYANFCSEFGYEPYVFNEDTAREIKNKSAWAMFSGCSLAAKKLRSFLGESAMNDLLYNTEPL